MINSEDCGKEKSMKILYIYIHTHTHTHASKKPTLLYVTAVNIKITYFSIQIYFETVEKMKFTNTLKNNVQLREEINGTKGMKQLQSKKTNIKHKTACLSQLINRGRRCRANRKKSILPLTVA